MSDAWNRCNICGKFIAYQDFVDGTATNNCIEVGVQDMNGEWDRDEYLDTFHNICRGPVESDGEVKE